MTLEVLVEHLVTTVNRRPYEPEHKAASLLVGGNVKNGVIAAVRICLCEALVLHY